MEATEQPDVMDLIIQRPEPEATEDVEDTPDVAEETEAEEPDGGDEPVNDAAEDSGEQDDDEPAQEEAEQDEQTFTVKVDGEDRQVSLDELTRSYAGQGYIQKRMQENAAKTKEVEGVYSEVMQMRENLAQLIQQVNQGDLLTPPKAPDASIREKDPVRYMRERDAYDAAMREYNDQQQQLQQFSQQQTEAQQRAMEAYQATQMRELSARIPELADPEKGPVLARQLTDAGQSYGFAPDEIGQVMDHRALLILHDAMKYRQSQELREKAAKKAEQARPIVKPNAQRSEGTSRKKAQEAARNQMRRTGSVDDVAAWLISNSKP